MKASDVMTTGVTTVSADAPLSDFLRVVREQQFSGLPVLDEKGEPSGLVSQNDVLRALAFLHGSDALNGAFQSAKRRVGLESLESDKSGPPMSDFLKRPVRDVMTPFVESCSLDTPVKDLCDKMTSMRIHRIVVMEDRKIVGMVSATDLVRALGETL